MAGEVDTRVLLAEHDGRITANAKAIVTLQSDSTLVGNLRVEIAKLGTEVKTKIAQLQWLMGLILLAVLGIAFALMRKGLL